MKLSPAVWLAGAVLVGAIGGIVSSQEPRLAVAGLIGMIGVVLSYARVELLVAGLVSAVLLEGLFPLGTIAGVPLTTGKAGMLVAMAVWFARCGIRRQLPIVPSRVFVPYLILYGAMAMAMAYAREPEASLEDMIPGLLVFILIHFLYTILRDLDLQRVLHLLAIPGIGLLVYCAFYGEVEGNRLVGVAGNPNLWGGLALWLGFGLLGALLNDRRPLFLGLAATCAIFMTANAVMSGSRGAVVAALPSLALMALTLRKNKALLAAVGVGITVMLLFVLDTSVLTDRFSNMESGDNSYLMRRLGAMIALDMFTENPLFGIGLGQFRMEFRYASSSGFFMDTHSMYLRILAEQGLIGAISYLPYIGTVVWICFSNIRRTWNTPRESMAMGLAAATLCWLACSATGGTRWETVPAIWIAFILAFDHQLSQAEEERLEAPKAAPALTLAVP